ncbi:unnamed protein product, partial [Brachionus calyciflorus]
TNSMRTFFNGEKIKNIDNNSDFKSNAKKEGFKVFVKRDGIDILDT